MNFFQTVRKKLKDRRLTKAGWSLPEYEDYRQQLRTDLTKNRSTGPEVKRWAHERGFSSDRVALYGLTEENYRDYISDLEFFWGFPYNNEYSKWIDDKLTFYYVLGPFRKYLPEYYYFSDQDGRFFALPDAPVDGEPNAEAIVRLLKDKRHLAVKMLIGSEGVGFYHLSWSKRSGIVINGESHSEADTLSFVGSLKNYLFSEYLIPCEELARIYPKTANSMRVIAIMKPGEENPVCHGLIRFGNSTSKEVDNTSQGSLFSILDVRTGEFEGGLQDVDFVRQYPTHHPDTGEIIKGTVPRWEEILTLIKDICRYYSVLDYLGFDIVVSTAGIKIIEINSLPEVQDYQIAGPLKNDPYYGYLWEQTIRRKGRPPAP